MFDHVGLKVSHLPASIAFYRAALAPLGIDLLHRGDDYAGFGPPGQAALWLHAYDGVLAGGAHVALKAPDRDAVGRFHAAGLGSGGRDNGAPGLRPDYSPGYYAAFLHDPDGHNIEAVCFV